MECLVYFDDLGYMSLIVLIIHMYLPKRSDLFEKEPLPMLYLSIIWYTLFKTVIGKIKLISCSLKKINTWVFIFQLLQVIFFQQNTTFRHSDMISCPQNTFLDIPRRSLTCKHPFLVEQEKIKINDKDMFKSRGGFSLGRGMTGTLLRNQSVWADAVTFINESQEMREKLEYPASKTRFFSNVAIGNWVRVDGFSSLPKNNLEARLFLVVAIHIFIDGACAF